MNTKNTKPFLEGINEMEFAFPRGDALDSSL